MLGNSSRISSAIVGLLNMMKIFNKKLTAFYTMLNIFLGEKTMEIIVLIAVALVAWFGWSKYQSSKQAAAEAVITDAPYKVEVTTPVVEVAPVVESAPVVEAKPAVVKAKAPVKAPAKATVKPTTKVAAAKAPAKAPAKAKAKPTAKPKATKAKPQV
jgi:hypothetical protein